MKDQKQQQTVLPNVVAFSGGSMNTNFGRIDHSGSKNVFML
jgi:hypothetical protein